jgi:transcriptional regulator with XRE-family HTH domain
MLLRRLIGSALRRSRLRQGRTLREVAHTARVSMPYLSEVERGRKEVSSEILAAVCLALGLQLGDLLDEIRGELALTPARPVPVPPGPDRTGAALTPAERRAVAAGRSLATGGVPAADRTGTADRSRAVDRTLASQRADRAPVVPGQPVASVARRRCAVDGRALRRTRPPARARRYLRHALPVEDTPVAGGQGRLPGQRLASFTLAGAPQSGFLLSAGRHGW